MNFEPTGVGDGGDIPAVCLFCANHAIGCGIGKKNYGRGDYGWLCQECVDSVLKVIDVTDMSKKRLDIYELRALDGGVDEVGDYLENIGLTDLALMDQLDARMIVKAAVQGYGKRLRQLIREGEAPKK